MKTPKLVLAPAALLLTFILQTSYFIPSAAAQPTAFTYQGFLTELGAPANSTHDFEFKLYNAASAGAQQGSTVTLGDVGVTNGLFTVALDFTATPFTGQTLWLDIAVRPGASAGAYTNLLPRQPITSAPYAIKAANAMTVAMGTISDPSFIGTTTAAPLQLQVSNTVGLRLEYPAGGSVPNLVGGFSGNSVGAGTEGAVIAGGGASANTNSIGMNSSYSAIGGGAVNNIASNSFNATIAGGAFNDISVNSSYSAIGGGTVNNIAANSIVATIAGGSLNDIGVNSDWSAIGGGFDNNIASNSGVATIAGGANNGIGVDSDYSAISGGRNNNIASNSWYATIAGGVNNDIGVDSDLSTIGGGENNNIEANSVYATIAGGFANTILTNAARATIGGGDQNTAGGNYATVPGGVGNTANGQFSLAAGHDAKAMHDGTFVWADSPAGGFSSTSSNQFLIRASGGVAIGTNDPAGAMLRVAGSIKADSFLGMGTTLMLGTTDNQPLQFKVNNEVGLRLEYPTVGSVPNLVGGFSGNSVGAGTEGAVIAGGGSSGFTNSIGVNSHYSGIGGGLGNSIAANSLRATIAGGAFNDIGVDSSSSAIGGGANNNIASNSYYATIAGGVRNDIGVNSEASAIGGGYDNNIAANSLYATIAGGVVNDIGMSSDFSAIGGGFDNNIAANSIVATIAGGVNNDIGVDSDYSAIGGGLDNNIAANAQYAVIPGGYLNDVGAGATNAFAAGHRAKANHRGAFVWGDSQNADFASTANNQFLIRASGGVGIGTPSPGQMLQVGDVNTPNSQGMMRFASRSGTGPSSRYWDIGVPEGDQNIGGKFYSFVIDDPILGAEPEVVVRWDTGNVGIGTTNPATKLQVNGVVSAASGASEAFEVSGAAAGYALQDRVTGAAGRWSMYASSGTLAFFGASANRLTVTSAGAVTAVSFNPSSDRNAKENFQAVNPREVLEKVAAMPISRWNFKGDTAAPHVGPMAQDFHAAFSLGTDDKHISTVDADGVALAAIQGLNQKVDAEVARLRSDNQALKKQNEDLLRRLGDLEAKFR